MKFLDDIAREVRKLRRAHSIHRDLVRLTDLQREQIAALKMEIDYLRSDYYTERHGTEVGSGRNLDRKPVRFLH